MFSETINIVISISVTATVTAFIILLARKSFLPRSNSRRRTDKKPLSKQERASLEKARQLFTRKQIVPAAQLLESIGLKREAVTMLEEGGHIEEAAAILMRMQRPNRAGVVYARHAMWAKAAECFKVAEMPLEVARCSREQKDYKTAADYFLRAEHFAEAAECFFDCGDLHQAAKNYAQSGYDRKATDIYAKILDQKNADIENFAETEIQFFIEQVSKGQAPIVFINILDRAERLADALFNLLRYGNFTDVARYLSNAKIDHCDRLNELVSGHDYALQNLIKAYDINQTLLPQARLFESIGEYAKASNAYDKSGDREQAARCHAIAQEVVRAKQESGLSFIDTSIHDESTQVQTLFTDHISSQMTQIHVNESQRMELSEVARNVHLFADLSLDERLLVLLQTEKRSIAHGDLIAQEASAGDGLYIIKEGIVRVSSAYPNATETRNELQKGESFGEPWAFLDELLPASYTAKSSVELLVLPKDILNEILDKNTTLARKLYKSLVRNIRFSVVTSYNYNENSKAS